MDEYHELTDEIIAEIEDEIREVYERSRDEISQKWRKHMSEVEIKSKKAAEELEKAKTPEEIRAARDEYRRVLRNATLDNARYAMMVEDVVGKLAHTNEIALDYANGAVPKIYTINFNGAGKGISEAVGGYSFTLVDEDTVKALVGNDKLLLPKKKLDPEKDKPWNTKKLNAEVLQGIIQGESVYKIADRIEKVTDANRVSAVRAARTLCTEAENKGRLDSYYTAERAGINLKKSWMATLDSRTRHYHRVLDGQTKELDEPFEAGGYKIMYPGEESAAPAMVYNCRCTMVSEDVTDGDYTGDAVKPVWADGMTDEEYEEWEGKHLTSVESLTTSKERGIITQEAFRIFSNGDEVNQFFGGSGGLLKKRKSVEGQWKQSLTNDESSAVSVYCLNGYYDLNAYLRQMPGSEYIDADAMKSFAQDLDSAINKFDLIENITVFRGVDSNALNDLDLENLVGSTYHDKGYMSTSPIHVGIVDNRDALLEIQVRAGKGRGAYVNSLSRFKNGEYEFLLRRGTKCEVTSVDLTGDKPMIKMKVIDE